MVTAFAGAISLLLATVLMSVYLKERYVVPVWLTVSIVTVATGAGIGLFLAIDKLL